MRLIIVAAALSLTLLACNATGQHAENVLENLKGVSRTAKSIQRKADTIAAGINKAERIARSYTNAAKALRDTTTTKPRELTKEEKERKFDSLHKAIME